MRVTQNIIYDTSVRNMNRSLSDLMKANMQLASEKRINKPSDDPAGTAVVLGVNAELSNIDAYAKNIETAEGWLSLADSELTQASTLVNSIIEKAQQASTGSYTAEERGIIAVEIRELYEELMNVANTDFNGQSIFAGQKTDSNAFAESLWATTMDEGIDPSAVQSVTGDASRSTYLEFEDSGTIGTDALNYRYTTDAGETWTTGTLAAGDTVLDPGAARMTLVAGTTITAASDTSPGSAFVIRPSMTYLGDDQDSASVTAYGAPGITADAQGTFTSDVKVRVDAGATLPAEVEYSYSLDNGATWITGNTASNGTLSVPGGILDLSPTGTAVASGARFSITPNTADIDLNISEHSTITVNNVGKDVFGGLYENAAGELEPAPGVDADANLFETVGELIGYLEVNSEDGIGDSLEKLATAHEHMLGYAGDVGARINRLDAAGNTLEARAASLTTYKSTIEDADVAQLTTDLARAQYIYEAVLSTSNTIMNLSLLNFM